MKNNKYKVRVTNGSYNAPSLIVEASSSIEAIQTAKNISGLSRFNNWLFLPLQIR